MDANLKEMNLGAGGPGPAGGGGGGNNGTGSVHYVELAPPPKPAPPPVIPQIQPPKPPEPVIPELEAPKLAQQTKIEVQSPIVGLGGGTGNDGTKGNGPGSGGGIGNGIGTGRGSATGPGTGGGDQENYPPKPTEMFIPPLPLPSKVKGFHLVAVFDIDEKGRIIDVVFNPTRDGDYNRKLNDILKSFKFLPGTTPKGVPVRAKFQLVYDLSG
jgi:protein TonB